MGFSRQEYWSGLPFSSPGDLPDPGIEPWSPALQADSLPSEPPGDLNGPQTCHVLIQLILTMTLGLASLVAQLVKNPPANAGDARDAGLIPELGRSPGKEMATHSSILA